MTNNRKNYRLDVDKIKTLKDVKNVLDNLHLLGYYDADDPNDENYYLSEYFTIPQERQGLTFSTPRKSLEQIQKEYDEKIDAHIKSVKIKFEVSKNRAERNYDLTFDRIISNFEYAQNNGFFPTSLTISGTIGFDGSYLVSNGSGDASWSSNFLIKPNARGVGYWEIQPNIQIWLNKKPTWIVRKCAKLFFDFGWNDAL